MTIFVSFQLTNNYSHLYFSTVAIIVGSLYYGINQIITYMKRSNFEVAPTWKVKKVYRYSQREKIIRDHMKTIQLWLLNSGSEGLSAFRPHRKKYTSEKAFCQLVLLQLLDKSRTEQLNCMLDFLHVENKNSEALSGALAHIILVALGINTSSTETLEAMKNMLRISRDSFIFDFVLINIKKDHLKSLEITASTNKEFDQYMPFLQTQTPKINRLQLFISKLPVVNNWLSPCKIFKRADMTPYMFQTLVQQAIHESNYIKDEYSKIPFLPPLDPTILAKNKNHDDNFKVTPMNISYSYMRSYKSHYTSLQTQLGILKTGLDCCMKVQECEPVASSPFISPYLLKAKQTYGSLFQLFRNEERNLFQFEQAFIISRMCSDIISVNDMCQQFSGLAFISQSRFIERHELLELKKLTRKNWKLILNLEKAFKMSGNQWNPKFKQMCQLRIEEVKRQCQDCCNMYFRIRNIWGKLRPVRNSVEKYLTLMKKINEQTENEKKEKTEDEIKERNEDKIKEKTNDKTKGKTKDEIKGKTEDEIRSIKKDIYDFFTGFLAQNGMELLNPFDGWFIEPIQNEKDSGNEIITKKVIESMVTFASKQIFDIKQDNLSLSGPKNS